MASSSSSGEVPQSLAWKDLGVVKTVKVFKQIAAELFAAHERGEPLTLETIRLTCSNVARSKYNVVVARQKWHIISDKFIPWVNDAEGEDEEAVKLRPFLGIKDEEDETESKTPLAALNLEEEREKVKELGNLLDDKKREFKEELESASAALKKMKADHKKVC